MKRRQPKRNQVSEQAGRKKIARRVPVGFMGAAILMGALILWGCGGEVSTPPPSVKPKVPTAVQKKGEAPRPMPPALPEKQGLAKKEETAEYTYNPAGKPDPFKPFIQVSPVRGPRAAPLTPLQRYEISQLKLVAIISAPEGNMALVEDSAGKGFFLKRGTLVGNSDGKVSKILKDRVIIEEVYQDAYGQGKSSETILYLHRPEEGREP